MILKALEDNAVQEFRICRRWGIIGGHPAEEAIEIARIDKTPAICAGAPIARGFINELAAAAEFKPERARRHAPKARHIQAAVVTFKK